jgi:COP9 signalosome complex subunit 5
MIEDPALAIVVDPKQTMSAGRVEIGVFRTYTNVYAEKLKQSQAIAGEASMPAEKFQEFGLHAHKYYKVEHSFFKTGTDTELLDRLWNEYWLHTLSSSPLLSNQETICRTLVNVVQKLKAINFMDGQTRGR